MAFYISTIDSLPRDYSDPVFDAPAAISLRVGANHRPQVAYKAYLGPVRYASLDDAGWRIETANPTSGRDCCLMLDSTGQPHVLFNEGITSRSEGSWGLNPYDWYSIEHAGGAIGSDGTVHAVLLQSFSGGSYVGAVNYAVVRGTTWQETHVDIRGDAFTSPNASVSLRLDSRSVARFCVTNTLVPQIRCWEGPMRAIEAIPNARWGSLAIDARDVLHLAYYDTRLLELEYAVHDDDSWSIEPVDSEGDVGAYASLALDRVGGAHIAYYDRSARDLKYAVRAHGSSTWTRCVVDAAGDVGSWTSLHVDADEHVHIAYWDADTRHVKYATTRTPVAVSRGSWTRAKALFR